MTKIRTWYKQHQYQWVREDFRKASDRILGGGLVVVGCLGCIAGFLAVYTANLEIVRGVFFLLFMVLGASWAGAFAIQWADKKLKE